MKTIGLQVSEKISPPIPKLPYSPCTAVTASSCTPSLGRLLPIRTQYPPLPVSLSLSQSVAPSLSLLLHLPPSQVLWSIFEPLLSAARTRSRSKCTVCFVFSLFYPFIWLLYNLPPASTPARLPTVKKGPTTASIIAQHCQFRLYLVASALYVPTSL